MYFSYGNTEIAYLRKRDPRLGRVIDQIGFIPREVEPNLFSATVQQMIGQQISMKAQRTIVLKVCAMLGEITPEAVCKSEMKQWQACGVSYTKANNIRLFAEQVLEGKLKLESLLKRKDEEVIHILTQCRGIGRWTAEMLLLFSLQRKDILSFGDFGIRRGLCLLHQHQDLSRGQFANYKKLFSPYGSIASLYLWEISRNPSVLEDVTLG